MSARTRRCRTAAMLLVAAVLVPGLVAEAKAPPEGLDPTYGTDGFTSNGFTRSNYHRMDAKLSALAPDGKLVIAGVHGRFQGETYLQDVAIARFNADGTPDDLGFSRDGKAFFDADPNSTNGGVEICDLLVDPDGRILISGTGPSSTATGSDVVLFRITAEGAKDLSFSRDGKLRINWQGDEDEPCGQIALRPDGRIVVATRFSVAMSFQESFAFAQLMPNGTFDTDFGDRGKLLVPLSSRDIYLPNDVTDLAIQGNKLVVVGRGFLEPDQGGSRSTDGFVARFKGSGAPDTGTPDSFSGDGWLFRGDTSSIVDVEVVGKKLLVLGVDERNNGAVHSVLGRLKAGGGWDENFSIDGVVRRSGSRPQAITNGAGYVTVAGFDTGGSGSATLWRYDADGVPDADYGGNGTVELSGCDASYDEASAACFTTVGVHAVPGGRVVVAGSARDCPGLWCPTYETAPTDVPVRFAAMRVVADPVPAVYAESSWLWQWDEWDEAPTPDPWVREDVGPARVAVRLTSASTIPVTVSYQTVLGTAAGAATSADFTHVEDTLTFTPGQVRKVVQIPITNDEFYEGPATVAAYNALPLSSTEGAEPFTFRLSSPVGATLPVTDLELDIVDNEMPPAAVLGAVGMNSVNLEEGSPDYALEVRLTHPSSREFWVDVSSADYPGEYSATEGADWVAIDERVTFQPGETSKSVTIDILTDETAEDYERFQVKTVATSMAHAALATIDVSIWENST